jgi:hypothetical protein
VAKEKGYNVAALEMDEYGNAARWPTFRSACVEKGIEPIPWYTDGTRMRECPSDARNVIAEIESHGDREGVLASHSLVPAHINRAIITDFNGFVDNDGSPRPDLAKPFVDAGYTCLTESYLPDSPNKSPAHTEFFARQNLGFTKVQPVFGCYDGRPTSTKPGQPFTLEDYAQWINMNQWWVWLAESVL